VLFRVLIFCTGFLSGGLSVETSRVWVFLVLFCFWFCKSGVTVVRAVKGGYCHSCRIGISLAYLVCAGIIKYGITVFFIGKLLRGPVEVVGLLSLCKLSLALGESELPQLSVLYFVELFVSGGVVYPLPGSSFITVSNMAFSLIVSLSLI
jgi:hypothetical protein